MIKKITAISLMIITMMCGICSVVPVSADSGDYVNVVSKFNVRKIINNKFIVTVPDGDRLVIIVREKSTNKYYYFRPGVNVIYSGLLEIYGISDYGRLLYKNDIYDSNNDNREARGDIISCYDFNYPDNNNYYKLVENQLDKTDYEFYAYFITSLNPDDFALYFADYFSDNDDLDFTSTVVAKINTFGNYPERSIFEFEMNLLSKKNIDSGFSDVKGFSYKVSYDNFNGYDRKIFSSGVDWFNGKDSTFNNDLQYQFTKDFVDWNNFVAYNGIVNISVTVPSDYDGSLNLVFVYAKYEWGRSQSIFDYTVSYKTLGLTPIYGGNSVKGLTPGKTYRYEIDLKGFTSANANDIFYMSVQSVSSSSSSVQYNSANHDVLTQGFMRISEGYSFDKDDTAKVIKYIEDDNADIDDYPDSPDYNVDDNITNVNYNIPKDRQYTTILPDIDGFIGLLEDTKTATNSLFTFMYSLFPPEFMALLMVSFSLLILARILGR